MKVWQRELTDAVKRIARDHLPALIAELRRLNDNLEQLDEVAAAADGEEES